MKSLPSLQSLSRFAAVLLPFVLGVVFLVDPIFEVVAPDFLPWAGEDKKGLGLIILVIGSTALYLDSRIASLASPTDIEFCSLDKALRQGLDELRRGDTITMLAYSSNALVTALFNRTDISLSAVNLLLQNNPRAQQSLESWNKLRAKGVVGRLNSASTDRALTSYVIVFGDRALVVGRYSPELSQSSLGIDWHEPFLLRGTSAASVRIITEHSRWINALIDAERKLHEPHVDANA